MRSCILFFAILISRCNGMDLPSEQQEKKKPYSQQIIFLNGTTTAGKSSIALSLAEKLKTQLLPIEILSIDSFVVPKVQWALFKKRINPGNIFVANEDLLQKSDMKQIKNESMTELCAAAIMAYKQNNIVIIDAPVYKSKHIEFYKSKFNAFEISNVSWILTYCPITTLLKRVMVRNSESSIIDQRSIAQALYQFSHMYQSKGDNPIDQLSKDNFDIMCMSASVEHMITQEIIPGFLKGVQKAICPLEFEEIKSLMLKQWSFGPDNIAPIKKE